MCVSFVVLPCACRICMVLIMAIVMSTYEGRSCCYGMCHHEFVVVYAFFMHASFYIFTIRKNVIGEGRAFDGPLRSITNVAYGDGL